MFELMCCKEGDVVVVVNELGELIGVFIIDDVLDMFFIYELSCSKWILD